MKPRDLRDMNDDQLEAALHDRRQELFNLRFQAATGALENTARLKLARRVDPQGVRPVRKGRGHRDVENVHPGPGGAGTVRRRAQRPRLPALPRARAAGLPGRGVRSAGAPRPVRAHRRPRPPGPAPQEHRGRQARGGAGPPRHGARARAGEAAPEGDPRSVAQLVSGRPAHHRRRPSPGAGL